MFQNQFFEDKLDYPIKMTLNEAIHVGVSIKENRNVKLLVQKCMLLHRQIRILKTGKFSLQKDALLMAHFKCLLKQIINFVSPYMLFALYKSKKRYFYTARCLYVSTIQHQHDVFNNFPQGSEERPLIKFISIQNGRRSSFIHTLKHSLSLHSSLRKGYYNLLKIKEITGVKVFSAQPGKQRVCWCRVSACSKRSTWSREEKYRWQTSKRQHLVEQVASGRRTWEQEEDKWRDSIGYHFTCEYHRKHHCDHTVLVMLLPIN